MRPLVLADSVGALDATAAGAVVVTGSHGGVGAMRHAAGFRPDGLVCHEAGVGKEAAGIAGLAVLDAMGIPACAVLTASAPIGDAAEILRTGIVSHVGAFADRLGIRPGQSVAEAVNALRLGAPAPEIVPGVAALDSITQAGPAQAGQVLVCGSHAAASAVRHASGLGLTAVFHNDAGGGDAALAGLALWEAEGIPAAAVDCRTARIGDGRDALEHGVLSAMNAWAAARGLLVGMTVAQAVQLCRKGQA